MTCNGKAISKVIVRGDVGPVLDIIPACRT
jgi:hypothetical protein